MLRLAFLASLALASAASAEEVTVHRPIAAASLHEGPLDMVAYFRPVADATYEVTATFAPHDAADQPMRFMMAMRDGDSLSFEMPGYRDATYVFARRGEALSIRVDAIVHTALSN